MRTRLLTIAGLTLGAGVFLYLLVQDPLGGGCEIQRDTVRTVEYIPVAAPPETVEVRVVRVVDSTSEREVDSLLDVIRGDTKRIDSLVRQLARPVRATIPFELEVDKLPVRGLVDVYYRPLYDSLRAVVRIDSLPARVETIRVTEYITHDRPDPTYIICGIVGGLIAGGALVWTLSD